MSKVRVRFAPSPTGYIHMGNVRSALFNYAFARAKQGDFLLRIEDTDLERHVKDSDRDICEVLSWLGLNWNEGPRVQGPKGPYYQSLRLETYTKYAAELVAKGLAYPDFSEAPPKDSERQEIQWAPADAKLDPAVAKARIDAGEPHCLRLRIDTDRYPDRVVTFTDIVRGEIRKECEDFVIIKRNGFPTYHFGVVVDDHLMEVSHVIRGVGHLDNTVKHVALYDAFGWPKPEWAHHSHTAGLSKRMGSPSVGDLMRAGYLPESVTNACLLMGWFPQDGNELFDFDDRLPEFSLERLVKAESGNFDEAKFAHICRHHMLKVEPERLLNLARPFLEATGFIPEGAGRGPDDPWRPKLLRLMSWVRERITHAAQVPGELWAFDKSIRIDDEAREALASDDAQLACQATRDALAEAVPEGEEMSAAHFKSVTKAVSKSAALKERKIKGRGYFHPLRAALTGRLQGPELTDVVEIIGRDAVLARFDAALAGS